MMDVHALWVRKSTYWAIVAQTGWFELQMIYCLKTWYFKVTTKCHIIMHIIENMEKVRTKTHADTSLDINVTQSVSPNCSIN